MSMDSNTENQSNTAQPLVAVKKSFTGFFVFLLFLAVMALVGSTAFLWQQLKHQRMIVAEQIGVEVQQQTAVRNEQNVRIKTLSERLDAMQQQQAILTGKVDESASQQEALDSLYQSLLHDQGTQVLIEVERLIELAVQHLQISHNVAAAIVALEGAEDRLKQLDSPTYYELRRSVANDLETLLSLPVEDITGLAINLDQLIDGVDTWPLLYARAVAEEKNIIPDAVVTNNAFENRWWLMVKAFFAELWNSSKSLVRIERLENKAIELISADNEFYLRGNIRIRLLSARLALLSGNTSTYHSDLLYASKLVNQYFDTTDSSVVMAKKQLAELSNANIGALKMPDISSNLSMVNTLLRRPASAPVSINAGHNTSGHAPAAKTEPAKSPEVKP